MFSKNLEKLIPLYSKPYFFTEDISQLLNININSARVFVTRYSEKGLLVKIRKNCYSFKIKWENNTEEDWFRISSILRVPSYISLLTALSYYGVSSQISQGIFENITVSLTKKYEREGKIFKYYKIRKKLFFGFIKKDNFFIAEKEKAFVDAIYLYSFGKYSIDLNAIDLKNLDMKKVLFFMRFYPKKTKKLIKEICRI